MTLTPKRMRALRLIHQQPGCYASALIDVCERRPASWTKSGDYSGFDKAATGAQAATRWGAGYVKPLIAAGLVRAEYAVPGWARLWLTAKGRDAVTRQSEEPKP